MVYLEETWLKYKDRFVAAFLCDTLHFGHKTTSPVESAHAALKSWITVSTGDLLTVVSACQLACDNQLANIRLQIGREKASTSLGYELVFSAVTGKVSAAALKFAFKEYKLRLGTSMDNNLNNDLECHSMITSNLGVPCRHNFRLEAVEAAAIPPRPPRVLCLEDFNSHWWLVQPSRQGGKTQDPISFVDKIRLIRDEFEEGTSYR